MPVFNNILAGAAGQSGGAYKIERSLRFTDTHSASLTKTFSSAGDRKRFTISLWVKRGKLGKSYQPFLMNTNGSGTEGLYFDFSSDYLQFAEYASNGWRWQLQSQAQFRDCSAWYHIVASVDTSQATASDRVKLYVNGEQITTFYTGLNTYPSLNLDIQFNNTSLHAIGKLGANTATTYHFDGLMAEFHFVDGQALPVSKFGEVDDNNVWSPIQFTGSHNVGSGVNGFYLDFSDTSSNAALGYDAAGSNNWNVNNISAKSNGWPEAVYAGDATYNINETSKAFYTGTGADLFDGTTNNYVGGQNASNSWLYFRPTTAITGVTSIELYGAYNGGGTKVNGSDVSVSPSWTTLDQWVSISNPPSSISSIAVKGTSGAAARLKAIKVNGTILTDVPASEIDSFIDSPVNYESDSGNNRGNYASLNPLANGSGSAPANGNLDITTTDGSYGDIGTTIAPTSGKFYVEFTIKSDADRAMIGIASNSTFAANTQFHTLSDAWAYYSTGGVLYNNSASSNFGDSYGPNDVIGIALDKDNNKLYFSKNGTFQNSGNPSAGTGGIDISSVSGKPSFFIVNDVSSAAKTSVAFNAGQRPFATSSVPTGFKSLCTTNLDDPLIENPSEYFDAKLWNGNGGEQIVGGGIRYSDYVTGDIDSSFPAYRAFRNDTSSVGVRTETATGATIVWQPPSPIAFTSSFKIWAARDGTHSGTSFTVTHAGGTTDFTSSVATGTTQTAVDLAQISGVTSPITKITVVSGGPNPRFSGIEVDGSMLIDSTGSAYNFSPDFAWIKDRAGTDFFALIDSVRGGTKVLFSNSNVAEETQTGAITAFNSDGFDLGSWQAVNKVNGQYVGWAWDTASSNTTISAGSLNSSVYTQDDVYSDDLSAAYNNGESAGFDGDLTTAVAGQATGAAITWTPSGGLSYTSSVRAYTTYTTYQGQTAGFSFNGGSVIETASAGWYTLATGSGTINSISHSYTATYRGGFTAIEVDGKILVDSNQTPPSVPSNASTCRASQESGFSIVNFTGTGAAQTTAHGLNKKPSLVLLKNRSSSNTYWQIFGEGYERLQFTTQAELTGNYTLERTSRTISPTQNSVSELQINANGDDFVAYCFAEVDQFSSIGVYFGNASAEGPFVFTGHRPRFLMHKRIDAGGASVGDWRIWDAVRDVDNAAEDLAIPNNTTGGTTSSAHGVDFLSNGFKIRTADTNINASNGQYMYISIAESPFKYSRAR